MTFIEVRDDLIVSIVSAAAGYSTKEYKVYQVPDYFNGIEGDNIKHFDSEWHRLTDKQLYEAGLIPLNENYKMNEDGSFSEKTIKEKIADGIITLAADEKLEVDKIIKKTDIELMQDGLKPTPEGQKIATHDGCTFLVPKTHKERYESAEITEEEYIKLETQEVIGMRRLSYIEEADPLFFGYQRGENTEAAWLEKIQEIKQRFPKTIRSERARPLPRRGRARRP